MEMGQEEAQGETEEGEGAPVTALDQSIHLHHHPSVLSAPAAVVTSQVGAASSFEGAGAGVEGEDTRGNPIVGEDVPPPPPPGPPPAVAILGVQSGAHE